MNEIQLKRDADLYFAQSELIQKATQKYWDEIDEAVNSGNFERIKKSGARLNAAILVARKQYTHHNDVP